MNTEPEKSGEKQDGRFKSGQSGNPAGKPKGATNLVTRADYIKTRQQSGDARLFEGEAPNSRGQWGNNFTRWFTGLLKANRIEGRKLGLHSFRHNFEDRLRAAELHGTDIGRELAGRSKGKDTSSSYGSGYSVKQLKAAMDRIDYSEVGLSL